MKLTKLEKLNKNLPVVAFSDSGSKILKDLVREANPLLYAQAYSSPLSTRYKYRSIPTSNIFIDELEFVII